ncbi:hypothetical protein Salat_2477400 [Sesamum alatum]|uniref:Uncharacterized protein n=1 Tax=Sesamum alatum TaxID=300844 RepID=A0AAE1XS18_9LAMI|nr:hypothetical protein Salat_2477400 [Sesamum alatum]
MISGAIPECVQDYVVMTRQQNDVSLSNSWLISEFPLEDKWYSLHTKSFETAYLMWKGKEVKDINHLVLVKLIDLSNNSLTGEIPPNITKLVGLVGMNVSRNNLSGSFPPDIGRLKLLNFLDLSRNRPSGEIPTSLGDMSHLGVLDLSYNNLSGRIPQSNQGLTFDESAYVGNVGLCGRLLNNSCPGDELYQDSNSRDVDGSNATSEGVSEDDTLITKGFYIALELGSTIGFWGILETLLLNERFRHAFFNEVNIISNLVLAHLRR